ncbi:MAG: cation:proton antiporter [Deltaproteobacteria bacterium]|nr:cation:proton antiporter [Deltaproteobacteria bacterium]MBW1952748.1 cation:proton antiporter [Deltaproteobacteria bacterium]MBW1986380.1 cation:proton antiporter [Deltaproteobacteria bacterium]MBW2133774.1 cation:proton antiporter [Deltaproteobacteria bacterium]
MEIQILNDLIVVLALSIAVLFVCTQIGVPVIIGFVLTGILSGPHVLGLVKAVSEVEILAEIGVILLLFAIGVEFSFANLLQIRKSVLLAGPLQVAATALAGLALALQMGKSLGEAIFIGFLLSLSSTAIVLKIFQERAEIDSPHGRTSLGMLIFQDIIIVPMMLLTPLLAGQTQHLSADLLTLGVKSLVIILLVIVSAKFIVPQVLYQIARTRSRELFLLVIVVICFAVAWLTANAGLSLALGAFLAGLIISETEYSHQALGNILPFRDVFSSFFFISIGMLLDVGFLLQHPGLIALLTIGALTLKSLVSALTAIVLRFPLRTAILIGLALSQVGEFSFILSKVGIQQGIFSSDTYQLFLDVAILTMVTTPVIMAFAPRIAELLLRLPWPPRLRSGSYFVKKVGEPEKRDHLIIIGFGINGRNLARAANVGGVPYVIIEMNPETVKTERARGEPIYFGDATQEEILRLANIKEARIVVVAINDPAATRRITTIARQLNANVHIIVRTRYIQEVQPLYELGANEVVPEEFETSLEIFVLVLKKYLVPREQIEKLITEVRANGYKVLRGFTDDLAAFVNLKHYLHDYEINTVSLEERSPLAGKSLAQVELRKKYGITVLAVRRDGQMLANPEPDMELEGNDLLIILGSPRDIAHYNYLFKNPDGKVEN